VWGMSCWLKMWNIREELDLCEVWKIREDWNLWKVVTLHQLEHTMKGAP
jgi:hypothetical protein